MPGENVSPGLAVSLDGPVLTCTLSYTQHKFAIKQSLRIPPQLRDVSTLPCEILILNYCND